MQILAMIRVVLEGRLLKEALVPHRHHRLLIPARPVQPGAKKDVETIDFTFRGISGTSVSPAANKNIAFQVLDEIKSSTYFDATNTIFNGEIGADEPPGTFTFKVTAKLKSH